MKWQGLEIKLVDCGHGVLELTVGYYMAMQFRGDRKEVEYVENGIIYNSGLTSVISFDLGRKIDNPEPFSATIPAGEEGAKDGRK